MLLLGLVLIALGALAIVSAVFSAEVNDGVIEFLGFEVGPLALFLIGVGSGVAILWGWYLFKYGTKKGWARRKEQKRLTELSEKLDKVDEERRDDIDSHEEQDRPTL